MKFLLEKRLRFWVNCQLRAEMASDTDANRKEVLARILGEYVRCGDAERFIRPDKRIGWRPTKLMLDRLEDEEADADAEY